MPKKSKDPAFFTGEADFKPFGLGIKAKDLIFTNLGLVGTVLGVKYLKKGEMDTGVIWVEYKDGFRSPLEKDLKGYSKCPDSDHIWRDVADYNKRMFKVNENHYIVHELNKAYRQELIDEDKKKKEAAEKKKLKKKKKKVEPDDVPPRKKV
ncbi:unnamed protein product [Calypogeia fissa]